MKSLILIILYLFKDTLYRWKERPASPLSRVLVAFFLSLCALSFLANYVLSTKLIRDQIRKNGADLVLAYDSAGEGKGLLVDMMTRDLPEHFECDVLALKEPALGGAQVGQLNIPIVEYGVAAYAEFVSLSIPLQEHPAILLINPEEKNLSPGPQRLNLQGFECFVNGQYMPENHVLSRIYSSGVILLPENFLETGGMNRFPRYNFIIRAREMTVETIRGIDETLRNIARLDGRFLMVQSMVPLLKDLDLLMSNQAECRLGFSIGISIIVGILLTALASMEFRQNEYVYTLMKSFGVRPLMLILNFIVENIFLVGIAFVAAVLFFMKAQKIVLGEFFKIPNAQLTYQDIIADLLLLGGALLLCVLVSSIPIVASAYRQIGKVLK